MRSKLLATATSATALNTAMPAAAPIVSVNDQIETDLSAEEALKEGIELLEFQQIVLDAVNLHYDEEDLDPVMLDCFLFWAIGGFSMNGGAQAAHDMWVKGQTNLGWSYDESFHEELMIHPFIRPFDELPLETQQVSFTVSAMVLGYASGLHTGATVALTAAGVIGVALRDAMFEGRPCPLDLVSKMCGVAVDHAGQAADADNVPHMLQKPLTEWIKANVHRVLTEDLNPPQEETTND